MAPRPSHCRAQWAATTTAPHFGPQPQQQASSYPHRTPQTSTSTGCTQIKDVSGLGSCQCRHGRHRFQVCWRCIKHTRSKAAAVGGLPRSPSPHSTNY
jgi:hypothetical protein